MIKGRILTIVVEIQSDEAAWIWDAHMKGPMNGVKVNSIANGDVVKEKEKLQEKLELMSESDQ